MSQRFTDQVAIVTGGASGLGEHFAKQLLAAGAQVAVGDVTGDIDQFIEASLKSGL